MKTNMRKLQSILIDTNTRPQLNVVNNIKPAPGSVTLKPLPSNWKVAKTQIAINKYANQESTTEKSNALIIAATNGVSDKTGTSKEKRPRPSAAINDTAPIAANTPLILAKPK